MTELAVRAGTKFGNTVQEVPTPRTTAIGTIPAVAQQILSDSFILSIGATIAQSPTYWSIQRDNWLCDFVKKLGNDLLAGAISTLISKVVSTSFYIEGPLALAIPSMSMLRDQIGFGEGWDKQLAKWVSGYLNRDAGGILENLRVSATDQTGPSMGFAHLDESKCLPTKMPEYPILYQRPEGGPVLLHRSQISRLLDTSEGRDKYQGIGFCSVSRALATAMILMDIVRYKRERLSDLPPAAILLLNNLTDMQWKDILKNYDTKQRNKGNTTWRDILVACGYDPAFPVSAELFELSSLPEHYDEKTATEMAIYTFALAFRVDPREYWPVSSGPLGTATEATLQHKKAKAKGEGIIFSAIEHIFNGPFGLPSSVRFKFDYQDDEDDMQNAEILERKIGNVRKMWEASPNAAEEGGIISTEEARQLLVRWGCVPPDIIGAATDLMVVYDTENIKAMYGPRAKVFSTGEVWVDTAA